MSNSLEKSEALSNSLESYLVNSNEWAQDETEDPPLGFTRSIELSYSREEFHLYNDRDGNLSKFAWGLETAKDSLRVYFVRDTENQDGVFTISDVYYNGARFLLRSGFAVGFPYGSTFCRIALVIKGQYKESNIIKALNSQEKSTPLFANPEHPLSVYQYKDENGIHF